MPSGGHWRAATCTCLALLALVISEKERRVFKLERPAEARLAGGGYFGSAASSKRSAAAAGPCFAFRRSQWGMPDPAIGICISPGLPLHEQSPVDPFSPQEIGTVSPWRGRKSGQGCSAPRDGAGVDRVLPGKSNVEHKPSQLPIITPLNHTAGEKTPRKARGCRREGESFQAFHRGTVTG